jgi:hypothetical protein
MPRRPPRVLECAVICLQQREHLAAKLGTLLMDITSRNAA